jgi:phosphate transport system substrate-binding protein
MAEFAYSGKYPLARFLYMYVNYKPGTELDPLRGEFIKFVLSQEGQQSVIKDGYFPISSRIANDDLSKLGITVSKN